MFNLCPAKAALKTHFKMKVIEGKANFESAEDNLQDLATYAIMMLEFLKKGGNK